MLPAAIVPLPNAVPHAVKSVSKRLVRFDALTSAFVAKLVVVAVYSSSIDVLFAEILVVFVPMAFAFVLTCVSKVLRFDEIDASFWM